MGDILLVIVSLLIAAAGLWLAWLVAWWAFRMMFWGAILFISMAGKAWRGEL